MSSTAEDFKNRCTIHDDHDVRGGNRNATTSYDPEQQSPRQGKFNGVPYEHDTPTKSHNNTPLKAHDFSHISSIPFENDDGIDGDIDYGESRPLDKQGQQQQKQQHQLTTKLDSIPYEKCIPYEKTAGNNEQEPSSFTSIPSIEDEENDDVNDDFENDENDQNDDNEFPSLPAFTVKVEIRPTPRLGPDQYGV